MTADALADAVDRIVDEVDRATATTTLSDGRTLAYATFGHPDGDPVVVFHGGVGSRGFGLLFADAADRVGARVVAPDRPGYGRSDPLPGRRVLDWPADVAALADALGHDTFAVCGVSGGGPYAAACAHALPERLTGTAMVSTMAPPGAPRPLPARVLLGVLARAPWLARIPIGRTVTRAREDPAAAIEKRASGKADSEASMHRGEGGRILTASTAESGRQGARYLARDVALTAGSWGFDLAAVDAPVGVWHGALDATASVAVAEYVADRLPDARLTVHDDVGHLSLPVSYGEEILRETLATGG